LLALANLLFTKVSRKEAVEKSRQPLLLWRIIPTMSFLYRLGISFYHLGIQFASLFSPKAKQWVAGRKNIYSQLAKSLENTPAHEIVWVHCASLGEFEQGRPLIELIKKETPSTPILLTFFSPSGYQVRHNYPLADWVYYLPIDTPRNAQRFLDLVTPKVAIFVKYEFWYYYLTTLKKLKVPTYLISATFRPNQLFFKSYGALFREMLHCFDQIFVQNKAAQQLLTSINYPHSTLAGDTRVDRVISIRKQAKAFPLLVPFCKDQKVLIAGSTWPADEEHLAQFAKKNPTYRLIIAPHEIDEGHLEQIEQRFSFAQPLRYSTLASTKPIDTRLIIIDNIGMLNAIYRYATFAYVGGGFGQGIHNILEAAVYTIPVLFGPNHQKFKEAQEMIGQQIAFEIKNSNDIQAIATEIENSSFLSPLAVRSQAYFDQHAGATAIIFNHIKVSK